MIGLPILRSFVRIALSFFRHPRRNLSRLADDAFLPRKCLLALRATRFSSASGMTQMMLLSTQAAIFGLQSQISFLKNFRNRCGFAFGSILAFFVAIFSSGAPRFCRLANDNTRVCRTANSSLSAHLSPVQKINRKQNTPLLAS